MFDESMVRSIDFSTHISLALSHCRITGEPFFGNPTEGFIYTDEHLGYGSSEHSPSNVAASASGFDFRSHPSELGHFLSAAVGHQQIFHGAVDFHPDESDDDDDDEEVDDEMSEESDDAQSDGDESSVDELDE